MQTFYIVGIAGFVVAGIILGLNVMAGDGNEPAVPRKPETVTPAPEEDEGGWTLERLREAKPIEMPHAPPLPPSTDQPETARHGPSQSGAGSVGSGDVAPEEETTLIPGLSKPDPGDDRKQ